MNGQKPKMALKIYNTYSRKKEELVPLEAGKIGFYVCGPTVYDYIHIGNGRAFVAFDVVRRFLKYLKFDVTYVMNITDIDDRIIERAQKANTETQRITEKYAKAFFEDTDALGIQRADIHPKATEHVQEMIALIRNLIDKGMAYEVGGDVFFDVGKFQDYGKLSGKNVKDLVAGSRVAIDENKKNPLDFVLWKRQKPDEPAWESPWGKGRPGWHVECSVMSMKYLGESFDIHAGGVDLVFPHHENEIAQSEGSTSKPFVKYWLHNGFLRIEGDKMAKSLGNFKTVREVLKQFSGEVIRLFFLQKHYRSPIDFTSQGLDAANSASVRLHIFYDKLRQVTGREYEKRSAEKLAAGESETPILKSYKKLKSELIAAMEDDFNTPVALSCLFDIVREINKLLNKDELTEREKAILGMVRKDFEEINSFLGVVRTEEAALDSELVNGLLNLLIEIRNELRAKKVWDLADTIRDELNKRGIILEDKSGLTNWRFK